MSVVVDRTDRGVLRVFGRDPVRMVQGLISNDIAGAPEHESVYATVLTPKGRMIADARVLRRSGGEVWIEADRAALANIAAHLKKSVPPLFARFEPLASHRVVGVYCRDAAELAAGIPHAAVLRSPFRADALDLITTERPDYTEGVTLEQLEVMRIEAGEPKWGAELTEDVIPLEAGLRTVAISETKGCYTGQEVIIRILHRGHVNRHLRGILVGTMQPPQPGTELVRPDDGKIIGRVTSACVSPRMGQAIALAYVRREVEPPATVQLAGRAVRVVELPFQPEK